MKKTLCLFCMLWASFAFSGHQFPRTGLIPENPNTETTVSIGIAASMAPCLGTSDNYPTFLHISEDNHISFVFAAMGVNPCIDVPGFSLQYDIGNLVAGDYTMQVYVVSGPSSIPTSINDPLGGALGDLIQFSVHGVTYPVPFVLPVTLMGIISLILILGIHKKSVSDNHRY